MAEASSSSLQNVDGDDSEWEYEYHETETEDVYVTLDLSSATKRIASTPVQRKKAKTAAEVAAAVKDAVDVTSTPNIPTEPDGENQDSNALGLLDSTFDKASPSPPSDNSDRIQFLNLHSPNPIVSYKNQFYSCDWTSTLGTDIFLANPEVSFPHAVLREEPDVSIIAATSIKLFGRPVQLEPHPNASAEKLSPEPDAEPSDGSPPVVDAESATEQPTAVKISRKSITTREDKSTATFLERMIAIKTAKSETDHVTVHLTRKRNRWKADAMVVDDDSDPSSSAVPRTRARGRGRPRSRRSGWRGRGGGPRGQKRNSNGGYYRPQSSDSEGADVGNDSALTPNTWDDLIEPSLIDATRVTSINTPTNHPQVSPPRNVPIETPALDPDPARHPESGPDLGSALDPTQTSSSAQPRAEGGDEGSGDVATGRGSDGPSQADGEMVMIAGGRERSAAVADVDVDVDGNVNANAVVGAGAADAVDDGDGDVEMEMGDA